MTVSLILGGQRSGKSLYAEGLLAAHPAKLYVATAEAGDKEMAARIAAHQARRGEDWRTVEAPLDLAGALSKAGERAVLVDCLSMWLANLIGAGQDARAETETLATALGASHVPVVLVSAEVGLGVIPANALARAYADALGTMNQRLAQVADRVVLVAAGLPLILKGPERP